MKVKGGEKTMERNKAGRKAEGTVKLRDKFIKVVSKRPIRKTAIDKNEILDLAISLGLAETMDEVIKEIKRR